MRPFVRTISGEEAIHNQTLNIYISDLTKHQV
jgi:hypothetical protein